MLFTKPAMISFLVLGIPLDLLPGELRRPGDRMRREPVAVTVGKTFEHNWKPVGKPSEQSFHARPRQTLRGLSGVLIVLEDLDAEVEKEGLRKAYLETQASAKLEKAGLRALTEKECFEAPGKPFLYISVNTYKATAALYSYSVRAELNQEVLLTRAPALRTSAVTWSAGVVGMVGARNLAAVSEDVLSLVDEFIRAVMAMNSK